MYMNTVGYAYTNLPFTVTTSGTGISSSRNTMTIESLMSSATIEQIREIRGTTGLSTAQIIEQCVRATVMAKRRHMRKKQERRNA